MVCRSAGSFATGAAPIELTNSVGTPLRDGLIFVNRALKGIGVRQEIRLIAAAGLERLEDFAPHHIHQRVGGTVVKNCDDMYPAVPDGCLLEESTVPGDWKAGWDRANAGH